MDDTLPPRNPMLEPSSASSRARSKSTSQERAVPTAIGPYRVLEKLGEGGMGIVYRCLDATLNRVVAVKVLHDRYALDEHYRRRFQREAQTVASLSHPSIAQVHALGETGEAPHQSLYIVMELVDGASVEALLQKQGAMPVPEALRIVRQAAAALREALGKGIIHRDVKPSNILVSAAGTAKIVDFGLAKDMSGRNSITDEGIVLGTPHYISPEQGRGRPVDHRADVYSLGATLYHMVTGRPPFEKGSQVSVIVAHVNDALVPAHVARTAVPETLSRVLSRMLEKSPEARYSSYDEIIDDLDLVGEGGEPRHARPAGAAAAVPEGAAGGRAGARSWRRAALIAGAAVLAVAAAGAFLLDDIFPQAGVLGASLGRWHRALEDGRDVIQLDFAAPQVTPAERELLRGLLLLPEEPPLRGTPPHAGKDPAGKEALAWESYSEPFALAAVFDEVDEVQLELGATSGVFDLGLALVDPRGAARRALWLRLRPSQSLPDPLVPRRHNESVPLRADGAGGAPAARGGEAIAEASTLAAPLPPVPRLGQGPFTIFWSFERLADGGVTRVRIRITHGAPASELYNGTATIEGGDWASGVLLLHTSSPVTPFVVSARSLLVRGKLARAGRVEEIPWQG